MEVDRQEFTSGWMHSEKAEVVWRIENFSAIWPVKELRRQQKIQFKVGSSRGLASEWFGYMREKKVDLCIDGEWTRKKICFVFLGLKNVSGSGKELTASLKVKIKTVDSVTGRDIVDSNTEKCYGPWIVQKPCCCGMCVIRPEWWIWNSHEFPLVDGTLVIEAEVTVMKLKDPLRQPPPQQNVQQIEARFKPRFCEKLQQDLGKLLKGPHVQKEARILSKDGVEFEVNRRIISVRSPAFDKMFQEPMTETQTRIVAIPDLSSKTVTVLLQFLYTGTLHPDWSGEQVLPELVNASNKYELQDLRDFLDQAVGLVVTKGNARRLSNVLGQNGMKKGEKEVLHFMEGIQASLDDMAKLVEAARENDVKGQNLQKGKGNKVSPGNDPVQS